MRKWYLHSLPRLVLSLLRCSPTLFLWQSANKKINSDPSAAVLLISISWEKETWFTFAWSIIGTTSSLLTKSTKRIKSTRSMVVAPSQAQPFQASLSISTPACSRLARKGSTRKAQHTFANRSSIYTFNSSPWWQPTWTPSWPKNLIWISKPQLQVWSARWIWCVRSPKKVPVFSLKLFSPSECPTKPGELLRNA